MGSQNRGIIIQKNNGFTEQRYYNIEKQWVHRIEVLLIQKNNGFTEQRYYNIEKHRMRFNGFRIEVL